MAFLIGVLGGFLAGQRIRASAEMNGSKLESSRSYVVVCKNQSAPSSDSNLVSAITNLKNTLKVCFERSKDLENQVSMLHKEKEECVYSVGRIQTEADEWRERYLRIDSE